MIINKFECGFCKDQGKRFVSTRKGLRKHLVNEHIRANSLSATWVQSDSGAGIPGHYQHPKYWIVKEFK
jgi:hypothetical protein